MNLLQGSQEWTDWRKEGVGASEVAAIVGLCPYNTPYGVWSVKTGRSKGFAGNSFTEHGKETEAKARALYELKTMEDMPAACAVHPKYNICRASLDGKRADNKLILEIKCPSGKQTIEMAIRGEIPENYKCQVQFQLAVTGADLCHYFVYHEESKLSILIEVRPDIEFQGKLIAAVLDFWERYVLANVAPPLTERDVKVIEDDIELTLICDEILQAKAGSQKARLDELKRLAMLRAEHPKMRCGRVQISTVLRSGKFSFHKLTIRDESEGVA